MTTPTDTTGQPTPGAKAKAYVIGAIVLAVVALGSAAAVVAFGVALAGRAPAGLTQPTLPLAVLIAAATLLAIVSVMLGLRSVRAREAEKGRHDRATLGIVLAVAGTIGSFLFESAVFLAAAHSSHLPNTVATWVTCMIVGGLVGLVESPFRTSGKPQAPSLTSFPKGIRTGAINVFVTVVGTQLLCTGNANDATHTILIVAAVFGALVAGLAVLLRRNDKPVVTELIADGPSGAVRLDETSTVTAIHLAQAEADQSKWNLTVTLADGSAATTLTVPTRNKSQAFERLHDLRLMYPDARILT